MDLSGIPADALWTYFMQVPIYLDSDPAKISRSHYLFPSNTARLNWKVISNSPKIKVGVRWQGNSKNERDLHRKVPLECIMETLHNTFKDDDVEYYSLQVGDGEEEASNYPELITSIKGTVSYDDTLAILENLDIVVTTCTSVLHASAIVGTKTLALIPISAYFTWVSPAPGYTSIWYPDNLQLFKQTVPGSWSEPLLQLREYVDKEIL